MAVYVFTRGGVQQGTLGNVTYFNDVQGGGSGGVVTPPAFSTAILKRDRRKRLTLYERRGVR